MFAYVTKREEDIPKDEVQIYDFDSDGKVVEIERDSSKLQALLMRRLSSQNSLVLEVRLICLNVLWHVWCLLAKISLSGTYDFGSDGCVIEGDCRATQQRPPKGQPSKVRLICDMAFVAPGN